jgi:hypothetical protein
VAIRFAADDPFLLAAIGPNPPLQRCDRQEIVLLKGGFGPIAA